MQVNLKAEHSLNEIQAATGKSWDEWFSILDKRGGIAQGRRSIGDFLYKECKLDPWWCATINIEYEAARGAVEKDGRPKGYMICVTKTIASPVDRAFAAWGSADGLNEWFGRTRADVADGGRYSNEDGDTGVFKRVRKNKDLRFTWENPAHTPPTIVDVVFQDKGKGKTGVMITHDRIQKREEADGLREGWARALDRLKSLLEG
jgi:uncharacterized protein YndB with AHSA1/START domain